MSNEERTVIFQLPTVVSGSLACMEGTVIGRTWRLSAGTFVIGRSDECDLHLPAEPGVSKVHAKVLAEGDRYVLEDNESRNGTIVNGHVVRRVILADGDEIQICGCRLRFTQTGGEGRKGDIVPDVATTGTPPSPPQTNPGVAAGTEPPTDLVPRLVTADPDAHPPKKSGGGLFMPFMLGLMGVLVVGGGISAALLLLGDDGQMVASGTGQNEPGTKAPESKSPDANPEATAEPPEAEAAPGAKAPEAASPENAATAEPPPEAESAPSTTTPEGASPEASPEAAADDSVAVELGDAPKTAIRTRGGGRVRSVEASNGSGLTRGQTILRLDDVALAREIATVTESVSALAAIAETSEGAKAALADEKTKLRALQSQARQQRVSSPSTGTLAGLTVRAGDRVRPRQVIGFVRGAGETVVAKVPVDKRGAWKRGAAVELTLSDGTTASAKVGDGAKTSGAFALIPLSVGSVDVLTISKARLK